MKTNHPKESQPTTLLNNYTIYIDSIWGTYYGYIESEDGDGDVDFVTQDIFANGDNIIRVEKDRVEIFREEDSKLMMQNFTKHNGSEESSSSYDGYESIKINTFSFRVESKKSFDSSKLKFETHTVDKEESVTMLSAYYDSEEYELDFDSSYKTEYGRVECPLSKE